MEKNFNLDSFASASKKMIGTNENAYRNSTRYDLTSHLHRLRNYTPQEIEGIINGSSLQAQRKLSLNYFYQDGYYRQIITYFATLMKYSGILIPHQTKQKGNSDAVLKKYNAALDYIEKMQLNKFLTDCALDALIFGSYYGLIVSKSKSEFAIMDLPVEYCQSRYKDFKGNDVIEFDISYFDTIYDETQRKAALDLYPKEVKRAYNAYHNHAKTLDTWIKIPTEYSICFPFFDGRPLFLNILLQTIAYDEALDLNNEQNLNQINKIIVQKIPHLNDGRLVFEPEEAAEIHSSVVDMMKSNPHVNVLTTYADVDVVSSDPHTEESVARLKQIEHNIYSSAGVSSEIFSSTGSNTLEASMNNDLSLMMYLTKKFDTFITNQINQKFGNFNLTFSYVTLPITYYNTSDYIDDSFKLASSGYSYLIPAVALGINQRDIVSIKDLENDLLQLNEKLVPLSSSYTQTNEGGRPSSDNADKSDKTIQNETSKDNTSGGGN